jgi:hypothetical protein
MPHIFHSYFLASLDTVISAYICIYICYTALLGQRLVLLMVWILFVALLYYTLNPRREINLAIRYGLFASSPNSKHLTALACKVL